MAKHYMDSDAVKPSLFEVIICYPGYRAVILHKIAHFFYNYNFQLIARIISEFSRFINNIEIHPGAKIGEKLFIDHGHGIVIGQTVIIKDNVTLYHRVTLGAKYSKTNPRHPVIGNNVIIGCNSTILGHILIPDNSRIPANSQITQEAFSLLTKNSLK